MYVCLLVELNILSGLEKLTLLEAVHRVRRVFEKVNADVTNICDVVRRRGSTKRNVSLQCTSLSTAEASGVPMFYKKFTFSRKLHMMEMSLTLFHNVS